MMIDDDTLKATAADQRWTVQLCKSLTEKRDIETSSRLIPLVDDLTHILLEAGKEQITVMQPYKGYFITGNPLIVHPLTPEWYAAMFCCLVAVVQYVEVTRFQLERFSDRTNGEVIFNACPSVC